jgi:hypothetical protein
MSTATMTGDGLAGAAGSGKASPLWSRLAVGTVRQILQRVDRAIHIGERELRYQLASKHDHPLAHSGELLFVLTELEELGLVEAELCFKLTDRGRQRLKPPDDGQRFAVMEDDSVLCGDCVAEVQRGLDSERAEVIVHAWIDPSPGTACRWCGLTANLDHGEGVGT